MGVASWHIRTLPHHIPPTFVWANLSLFTLEFGGQADNMESNRSTPDTMRKIYYSSQEYSEEFYCRNISTKKILFKALLSEKY